MLKLIGKKIFTILHPKIFYLMCYPCPAVHMLHTQRRPLSSQIVLIRFFFNFVTLFSTIMSSSSSIMVHIPPCLQELWSFVYENLLLQDYMEDIHAKEISLGHTTVKVPGILRPRGSQRTASTTSEPVNNGNINMEMNNLSIGGRFEKCAR